MSNLSREGLVKVASTAGSLDNQSMFGRQNLDDHTLIQNATGQALPDLSNSEIITLVIVGILGIAGMVMNGGVMGIVYKGRLVKKDYRMLYYIFITFGDFLFASHTMLNALNILFREVYVFKIFAICWNIQITLGVVAYQWSALCIILLIVDLVWSIKKPFSDDGTKKTFSKFSCAGTFFLGIFLGAIPYIYWNDAPKELPFCSIANVYGVHWNEYQYEAVVILSIMFTLMLSASLVLLYEIYRTQQIKVNSPPKQASRADAFDPEKHKEISTTGSNTNGAIDSLNKQENGIIGVKNVSFICDDDDKHDEIEAQTKVPHAPTGKDETTNADADDCRDTQYEARRKAFIKACRTVGMFMVTYIGSCGPYYIWMAMGIGCGENCKSDTPQQRIIRALVATALYMLPIIDPILYTQRFDLFKSTFKKCFGR